MRSIDDTNLLPGRFPGQRGTFLPEPRPEALFCPIVSADDHVLEPADVFTRRMPAAMLDHAPHVVPDAGGVPYWHIEDRRMPVILLNGAVGRPFSEWDVSPQRFDEFRPGVMDLDARLADMDLCGIWASLCFPSIIWGFTGSVLSQFRDQQVGLAALRAYNDWMLEDWCGGAPGRFIACQLPWLSDPQLAADEIRRNAARGFRSVSFSENPEGKGFPSIHSGHWDPFFAACEETGTVINLHVGSSGIINQPSSDSPMDVLTALFPVNGITAIVDWIYSKIPVRYPGIRIALSEAGASWVPMVIERLHRAFRQVDARTSSWERADGDPADYLHRNFWFTSLEDPSAFHSLHLIGEDKVLVETDYPHQDSTWPTAQAMVRRQLSHLPPETVAKVCFANACALYRHPEPPAALVASSEVGQAMRLNTSLDGQALWAVAVGTDMVGYTPVFGDTVGYTPLFGTPGGLTMTMTDDPFATMRTGEIAPSPAPADFAGTQAEWDARVDLAACYRIVAHYGWDDLIATHISARVPGEDDAFLINDFGLTFEEITASSLVKVNLDGEVLELDRGTVNPAGFTIHSAVYQVRDDVGAVIHLHSLDGMAVSTSADGLLPLTQTAMTVVEDIAYHDFEGVALDLSEREHLQEHLGLKNNMILRHHGTMSVGDCMATAFVRIYQLERACTAQVRALATRCELATVDPAAIAKTSDPGGMMTYGRFAWPAVRRKLDRLDASYRS